MSQENEGQRGKMPENMSVKYRAFVKSMPTFLALPTGEGQRFRPIPRRPES